MKSTVNFEGSSLKVERHTVHISDDSGRIAMQEIRTFGSASDDNDTDEKLTRYIYSNHLQSAALELDAKAAIISYEEYHPYGTTSYQAMNAAIKATAKRYRYTGKERDEESGLYYHGARYYIPWLALWTASDPMESKYAGMSPYNYSFNNPVMYNDPSGADPGDPNSLNPEMDKYPTSGQHGDIIPDSDGGRRIYLVDESGEGSWEGYGDDDIQESSYFSQNIGLAFQVNAYSGVDSDLSQYGKQAMELRIMKNQEAEKNAAIQKDIDLYMLQEILTSDLYGNTFIGSRRSYKNTINAQKIAYGERFRNTVLTPTGTVAYYMSGMNSETAMQWGQLDVSGAGLIKGLQGARSSQLNKPLNIGKAPVTQRPLEFKTPTFSLNVAKTGGSTPIFIVSKGGTVFPVPKGATGPVSATSGKGFQYIEGVGGNGLSPKATGFRFMDPVTTGKYQYPGGYGSYFNKAGQAINPLTGQTIAPSNPWWHIPAK